MKAFLLAGGLGTRLRPITNTVPKCLVEIGGKPLLELWLTQLVKAGCTHIRINTHYLADAVNNFICSSPYRDFVELVHEDQLLGTLGTLRSNLSFFEDDDSLIAHADNLCIADWSGFLKAHRERQSRCDITMMLFDTDTPNSCGMVELSSDSVVTHYVEKPEEYWPTTLANGAVFFFAKSAVKRLAYCVNGENDLCKDFIPKQIGRMATFKNTGVHIDIGSMNALSKARHLINNHKGRLDYRDYKQ